MFKKFDRPRFDQSRHETVKGNWKCSECGAEITELPFEPAPDRPIYCRECWRNKRNQRFER
ncbi:MAG: hypothetical protein COU98_01525 [Candidatus Staskawiczbacteria bacterium CG10_big_fil_rev_8_21_14_0_10_38_10]|uniref:CxxC-x17-CxxC domain-containing protein n=1 Tax=Candidatus Staskawiczbacteria bacterium CG10_big_fil_rev_8_21_14_0_10_38_10 TaxID=1974891 RepID=A0A2H9T1J6_9BACT|nr:MAG: hypothetical protein COU98_01525 [Candidatus Staskawiczbacteria bacterium CG10_big_fil_rev_8_21_14_0_10_38_10]